MPLQANQPQTMGVYRGSFVPYLQYLGHPPKVCRLVEKQDIGRLGSIAEVGVRAW